MDKTRPLEKAFGRLTRASNVAAGVAGLLAQFLWVGPLSSQTIHGRLVDEITGGPIAGAFVILLSDSTELNVRTLTSARGEFTLRAPIPGRYRLKSAVIGVKSRTSQPIDLAAGQTVEFDFIIRAVSITLPTVVVRGDKACHIRREASLAAATLWEEAQKALYAVEWTEEQGTLRHRLVQYQRLLDPSSLRTQDSLRWSQSGIYRGSPFRTVPIDELVTSGFIKQTGKHEYYYYGPDARILLSEQFANLHCFWVKQRVEAGRMLIGLAFRPVAKRSVPDIEGVLWLDQESARLQFLEYGYTRVPNRTRSKHLGGRVEFERLPDGPWIVGKWWIRMPVLGVRQAQFSDFTSEAYLAAIKEMGGWVREIQTLDGKPIERGLATSLVGKVVDLATAAPVPGVRIVLLGTSYETRTDERGRFWFHGLAEDTYEISFAREFLDSLGFVPPKQTATLRLGHTATAGIAIASASSLWERLCPSVKRSDSVGIVAGFIRDAASGKPLRDAELTLSARFPGTPPKVIRRHALSDWAGYYYACGIPQRKVITVQVKLDGWSGVATSTQLSAGDIIQLNFELSESGRTARPVRSP
ncbi:MAG: carboxypeptidase-like regulatory domain-containing protein [Gemmatimonadales bacterium]